MLMHLYTFIYIDLAEPKSVTQAGAVRSARIDFICTIKICWQT